MSRLLVVVAMAVGALWASAGPATAVPRQPGCLSQARIEHMRDRPASIPRAFRRCQPMLERRLRRAGIATSRDYLRATFAGLAAHRFAPYGSGPPGYGFSALRRKSQMGCDSFAALTFHLYERTGGRIGAVRFRGWDGGTIGNHAQVWVGSLLVDATAGLVARLPVRAALAGRRGRKVLGIPVRRHHFYDLVRRVVARGEYPEAQVLYVHRRFEAFARGDRSLRGNPPR
jgi:hypothetical protein